MSLGSGIGHFVRLWCCKCHWESRPQGGGGITQAWTTWSEGASAPNGKVMCQGRGVPKARSARDGDTGNEDDSSFARFCKLDNDKFKL